MSTPHLGSIEFTEVPTVNGQPVLLAAPGSGAIIRAYSGNISQFVGNTQIPFDTTLPQNTEGTEVWSTTVTRSLTASRFLIDYSTVVGDSNSRVITLALFRDGTCITCRSVYVTNTVQPQQIHISYVDTPPSDTSVYSLRVGHSGSGTWSINGRNGYDMGNATDSSWRILEMA